MRGLIQRVARAEVAVDGATVGQIGRGVLLLLGVQKGDGEADVLRLARKVVNYRIFADDDGHMNRSLIDVEGELLIVSQFTIAADTKKGLRPSFSSAAAPAEAEVLYEAFIAQATALSVPLATGIFGANMQVDLVNDGPVTFLLSS
jgi:D-tyrosyl-tRNA(Tyr) deacylase